MQKITPHFWYDKEAESAAEFYVSLFKDSKIKTRNILHDTPSGDAGMVSFVLANQEFMAISAGPYFTLNPSISMFTVFDTEEEITSVWNKLVEGGKVLMEFNSYPWATKYGWLEDKYGLSWQLSMSDNHKLKQQITPALMFTKQFAGKAKEAIDYYTQVFPNSSTEMIAAYEEGEGDTVGYIKHARFNLSGHDFIAMDSSGPHEFVFNEAVSLMVTCDTQEEIDYYWEKLSAVPEAEQCGWLKDKFGVSWQITPKALEDMMSAGTPEQIKKVTQAFLQMKKFDIAKLKEAYEN